VQELELLDRYDAVLIMDDDTTIAPDFVRQALRKMVVNRRALWPERPHLGQERRVAQRRVAALAPATEQRRQGVGIVVGKTLTDWRHEQRWNVWVGSRAYSYWRYQATIRAGQDRVNALNCISGSNSIYSSPLLREVLVERTPYIVDDTYWVLETQRRKLGRVVYAPDAHAWIQDPTTFRDWYKQNLRWLWGSFQGVVGHRVGRERSWFDFWYLTLIADWCLYVLVWPVLFALLVIQQWAEPRTLVVSILAGYLAWTTVAALALRKWRLVLLTPAIIAIDVLYRANFIHAVLKTIRQPTVESCRWDSPTRYQVTPPPQAAAPVRAREEVFS
jgi:cellulose synthase/poly-beta-1,6-N-acetylglucosamine synthase-like glycosyltransferase